MISALAILTFLVSWIIMAINQIIAAFTITKLRKILNNNYPEIRHNLSFGSSRKDINASHFHFFGNYSPVLDQEKQRGITLTTLLILMPFSAWRILN